MLSGYLKVPRFSRHGCIVEAVAVGCVKEESGNLLRAFQSLYVVQETCVTVGNEVRVFNPVNMIGNRLALSLPSCSITVWME